MLLNEVSTIIGWTVVVHIARSVALVRTASANHLNSVMTGRQVLPGVMVLELVGVRNVSLLIHHGCTGSHGTAVGIGSLQLRGRHRLVYVLAIRLVV